MLAAGAVGFKCFLINSGVEEFHFVTASEARTALNELKGTGAFLMFHAELEPDAEGATPSKAADDDKNKGTGSESGKEKEAEQEDEDDEGKAKGRSKSKGKAKSAKGKKRGKKGKKGTKR